jgi:hypothetical protein
VYPSYDVEFALISGAQDAIRGAQQLAGADRGFSAGRKSPSECGVLGLNVNERSPAAQLAAVRPLH